MAMQTRAPGRRVALIFTKSTTTRDSGCEVHWTRALSWKPSRNLPCWAPLPPGLPDAQAPVLGPRRDGKIAPRQSCAP